MTRNLMTLVLCAVLAGVVGCSSEPPEDPAEAALTALAERFEESGDAAEKANIAEEFLTSHPDSPYTGPLAQAVAEYRGGRLGDPEGAYRVLEEALSKAESPDSGFQIAVAMAPLAAELDRPFDLRPVADDLAARRQLGYDDHDAIMKAAEKVGDWQLAADHAQASLAGATVEAIRAEFGSQKFTDDKLAIYAAVRRASSLAHQGWAVFNLGRIEEGMSLLDEAGEITPRSYMGVPSAPVDLLQGRALLSQGEAERAIEVLLPGAVFGDAREIKPVLQLAYSEFNGNLDGFEDYLQANRRRLAKRVDDVTLPDYQDVDHTLSDLSGRVVLLAFWFPT